MSSLKISLRAGERLFLNGAVFRVDRKTQIEILNDVSFLLESHVMQASETTTPLRQLYFIVQLMLIDPANATKAREVFESTNALLLAAFQNEAIREGLMEVEDLVTRERAFDALKRLRALIPMEDRILNSKEAAANTCHDVLPFPLAVGAR